MPPTEKIVRKSGGAGLHFVSKKGIIEQSGFDASSHPFCYFFVQI